MMTQQQRKSHHSSLRKQRLIAARAKGSHTDKEWAQLKSDFGYYCVRCGCLPITLHKDHITPIYQGGSDGIDNIQPLCPKCNSSKGSETTNWVQFRIEQRLELEASRG